ncbi:hypothetical protein [Mucilaginibacter sp. HD30]
MMKYRLILSALIALSACNQAEKPENSSAVVENKLPDSLLIKAGERIGNMKIGDDMQALLKQYGQPDQQDAAMGSAAYTWFPGHDTTGYRTSVYGHRNFGAGDERLNIKKIMTTSTEYSTPEGVHTGTDMDDVSRFYTLTSNSNQLIKGRTVGVFADIGKGISFDIDPATKRCTAISIFRPGDTSAVNINIY